jgi:hypothetical protein
MAWLNAEGEMPSSVAAARKLRCVAIATTAFSSKSQDALCDYLHQVMPLYADYCINQADYIEPAIWIGNLDLKDISYGKDSPYHGRLVRLWPRLH